MSRCAAMSPTTTGVVLMLAAVLASAPVAAQQQPPRVVRLHVTATVPDPLITLDGEPVAPIAGVLVVSPGQHTLTAELEDGRYWSQVVDVTEGQDREVALGPTVAAAVPEPVPRALDLRVAPVRQQPTFVDRYPQRRLSPAWAWTGVGVSTLLATGLVYAVLRTTALSASYQEQPTRAKLDEGLTYRGATQYVLLPATAASIGLTVLAFVLSAPTTAEP